jgi:signal transduction histidine kinase
MYKQVELKLKNEAEQLIGEFENSDNGKEKLDTNTLVAEVKEYEDEENLLAYYNADKELILSNRANYVFVDKLNFDGRNLENNYKVIEVENENHDGDWAVLTLPIYTDNRNFLGWIKLGNPLESETEILDKLLVIFILGIPLFLITAVIGGYFLAWKALSPIDKITRTARDISSNNLEKRIEEKNMDDEVGRLITTLNQLFSRLEKAFKREKQFTADASHELRTPITVIRAQSEKTLREKDLDENCRDTLEIIRKQADYMGHLVEQLLLLARSDSGKKILEKEEFDLNMLIEMVTDEIREIAKKKNIEIINKFSQESIYILADQSMIIQLLLNLLDNAIKYTAEGGMVEITTEKTFEEVIIQIKDNGMGIPKKDQENIFKRFYRVDKSRSRHKGGTGLGLAICEWIIKSHEGNIRLKSEPGEGTEILIRLPLA